MKILFATHNAHKADEVRALVRHTDITLQTLSEAGLDIDPPEDHDTFEANALQKAHFVHAHTGLPCIADDSGIEVDALDGRPGVHSKRYSPEGTSEANNALLLTEMSARQDRTARFRCVLAIVGLGKDQTVDGRCEGQIAHTAQGQGGFGYDPIFLPDEAPGRSMAELSMDEKNQISHRGRAFSRLPDLLRAHR